MPSFFLKKKKTIHTRVPIIKNYSFVPNFVPYLKTEHKKNNKNNKKYPSKGYPFLSETKKKL